MKRTVFVLFIGLSYLLFSCEEQLIGPDPKSDNLANFDFLWEDVRNRYSFFELKEIDWVQIRDKYRPMVRENMSRQELFDLMGDMLYELKDGHVNLSSEFDRSRNWDWYLGHPANFDPTIVERYYLGRDFRLTGPLRNQILESVLYIYYPSFSSDIAESHLEIVMQRAASLKGIIIDVRNNGGGNLSNARKLASCFTDKEVAYAKERRKTGPGPNEFSEWATLTFPSRAGRRFEGKVIVLTNRACYSATSFFVQMMKTLPNVTILGDQTGGGGGAPSSGELPNGWQYRLSVTQTIDLNGEQIEPGVGVDVPVQMLEPDLRRNRDTLIETALRMLR